MSDDPNLNLGVGGGTPPLGPPGPSLEDDEKALKKGNTGVLVAAALVALGAAVALGVLLTRGDPSEPYRQLGQSVNGMKSEHFDGFWACALPNQRLDNLRSNQELSEAISVRSAQSPARYAQHVRTRCLTKLSDHEAPLRALIPPEDLLAQVAELDSSLAALRAGWTEHLAYLEHAEQYDEAAAGPTLNKVVKGWYDYRSAHRRINETVREHLSE